MAQVWVSLGSTALPVCPLSVFTGKATKQNTFWPHFPMGGVMRHGLGQGGLQGSGKDGILKDDSVKVLHSICQQMWKTQQWPQDWKRSVFIPIPKKGNAKECSNYHTIALISHASKVMLKILNIQKTKIMAPDPITPWQIYGETMERATDFIFLGSKITADGDCSHEIKRRLLT